MATIRRVRDPVLPRLHLIGGKGGVGKTTCAAAFGIAAARAGARVLVVSTDPAPSLADAFGRPLSHTPRPIPVPGGRLHAAEIRSDVAFRRWIGARRRLLESIAVEGTWLDLEDVQRLLGLSLPGIDEVAALFEIDRLLKTARFDHIVIDTAPTGHTLHMLQMPETFSRVAALFEIMRWKPRAIEEALRGRWVPRVEDRLVDELACTARELTALIRDPSRTRVSWVTLPEPLAIAETRRAIDELESSGIRVARVIANRLTAPPADPCRHCDARRRFEHRALRTLRLDHDLLVVHERHPEPTGARRLLDVSRALAARSDRAEVPQANLSWRADPASAEEAPADSLLTESTTLVMFGGKGGVGKTTCAAATALRAARRWPEKRILLLSTDPAHSLGDVLQVEVGDGPFVVALSPGTLHVRELDPAGVLARLRRNYLASIDEVFGHTGDAGAPIDSHDWSIMRGFIELAPPGLDELAAVLEISEQLVSPSPAWDLVVMDTAPTGHAVRLLETPALIQEWARALMSILLKYQPVMPIGRLGIQLLDLSKAIGRLRALLSDASRAHFIVVAKPEALPRLESVRLMRALRRLGLAAPTMIVNGWGRGTCRRCRAIAAEQQREVSALATAFRRAGGRRLVQAPSTVPPPAAPRPLVRWGGCWRGLPAP